MLKRKHVVSGVGQTPAPEAARLIAWVFQARNQLGAAVSRRA